MPKYLSGRQKLRASNKLTEDRYQYLGLDQAEPNLADPLTSPGVPSGTQYQLIAVAGYDGRRYWVPVGGSVIPGAITIFDEGTPVSSASSITQMNFVGAAVTSQVSVQSPSGHPGIAATITVVPVNIGENPPVSPAPITGELWWESDTGDLYVYYDDGDSAPELMARGIDEMTKVVQEWREKGVTEKDLEVQKEMLINSRKVAFDDPIMMADILHGEHLRDEVFDPEAVRAVTVAQVNEAIKGLGKCTLVKAGTF